MERAADNPSHSRAKTSRTIADALTPSPRQHTRRCFASRSVWHKVFARGICRSLILCEDPLSSSRPKRPVVTAGFERRNRLCVRIVRRRSSRRQRQARTTVQGANRATTVSQKRRAPRPPVASASRPDRNRRCGCKSHRPGPNGNLSFASPPRHEPPEKFTAAQRMSEGNVSATNATAALAGPR